MAPSIRSSSVSRGAVIASEGAPRVGHRYNFRSAALKTHSPGSSSTSRMFSTQAVSSMNFTRPIVRDAGTVVFARPAFSSTSARGKRHIS